MLSGKDNLRVSTDQSHDGEEIVPLIGKDLSALRFYMQLNKKVENRSASHPVSSPGELSRQEAQENEDVGEGDNCSTAPNDAATLVRVEMEPGFTNRSSGHYCINSRDREVTEAIEDGSACARIERDVASKDKKKECV